MFIRSSFWDKHEDERAEWHFNHFEAGKDNYFLAWKLSTFSKRRVRAGRETLSAPPGSIHSWNQTKIAFHSSHCSAAVGFKTLLSPSLWLIIVVAWFPFLISYQKLWCVTGREGNPPAFLSRPCEHIILKHLSFSSDPWISWSAWIQRLCCEQVGFSHLIREHISGFLF